MSTPSYGGTGPSGTAWHLDAALADAYAGGRVGEAAASSVEAHVIACASCQALLTPRVDPLRLDRIWGEVTERVQSPEPTLLERLLHRLRLDEGTARLVAATPSLRAGWFTGVVVVLALAVAVSHTGAHGVALFLALAPVLPMLGVALAFGPATDPVHEISAAAPYSAVRLLAARGLVVVSSTVLLAGLAALLLPGGVWLAAAWLLPALALTVTTVLLAARLDPLRVAVGLTLGWVALVLPGLSRSRDPLLAASPVVQGVCALVACAVALALATRRDALPEKLRRKL
jgi:hypothetical protein